MRCARVRDHFDDLLDGRLEEVERTRVTDHLATCSKCASEYDRMRRVILGLRSFPRPSPPPLEAPVPAGEASRLLNAPSKRFWTARRAAAVLLFCALGITHFLAFYLGGQKNKELAEIGTRELSEVLSDHLEKSEKHLRFARVVTEENPEAYSNLVNTEAARELRATALNLFRVSEHPPLRAVRPYLQKYADSWDELERAREPSRRLEIIARMQQDSQSLRRLHDRNRLTAVRRSPPMHDSRAVVREGHHRFLWGDYAGAVKVSAEYLKKTQNPDFPNIFFLLMGESNLRMGEFNESSIFTKLIQNAKAAPKILQGIRRGYHGKGGVRTVQIETEADLHPLIKLLDLHPNEGRLQMLIQTDFGPFNIVTPRNTNQQGFMDVMDLMRVFKIDFRVQDNMGR